MKRFSTKKVVSLILAVGILAIPTHSVNATEYLHTGNEGAYSAIAGQPELRRCDIDYVYSMFDGVRHERLWCYTCREWAEDDWSVS